MILKNLEKTNRKVPLLFGRIKKKEFKKANHSEAPSFGRKTGLFFFKNITTLHEAKMIQRFRASFEIKRGQMLFYIRKGQFPGNGTETYSSCILTSQIFSV